MSRVLVETCPSQRRCWGWPVRTHCPRHGRRPHREARCRCPLIDVLVERHDVDALKTDVDTDAGLAVPEEVRQLLAVRRVVGGLELASRVNVLKKHVRRRVHFRLCAFVTLSL